MGTGRPSDTAPVFAVTVADRTYTEGEAISPLMLPEASSGNDTLSYSLTPTVPGLTFNSATRTLSGTPTAAGTYDMTYQAVDGDANTAVSDAATVTFTITVQPAAHARGLLGRRGDLARIEGLQRTSAGRIRPRCLRNGLQQAGRRHHRSVAVNDEGKRDGSIRPTLASHSISRRVGPRRLT